MSLSKTAPEAANAEEGNLLPVCKLNTYLFCPRRFYLECVQGEFNSNFHTEQGNDVHALVDERERVYVASERLGICAYIDKIDPEEGVPVEYKKGAPPENYTRQKPWLNEAVQLCAQGLLLEESIRKDIPHGYLYYDGIRRRVKVDFDWKLRQITLETIEKCVALLSSKESPPPLVDSPKCGGCSLVETCMPDELNTLRGASEPARYKKRCLVPMESGSILYVNQPGSGLRKDGDTLLVTAPDQPAQKIGIHRLREIWIHRPASISASALELCLMNQVPVLFHNWRGRYLGQLIGPFNKNVFLRRAQFRTFEDPAACLELAQTVVRAKIRNQRVFIGRNHPEAIDDTIQTMKKMERQAEDCTSLDQLLGLEGTAAAAYFSVLAGVFKDPGFEFNTRKRRPARDPVNALLGFGYTLLSGECVSALQATGLDPYFGFYHQSRYGRPALALDILEPLRPVIVDSLVLTLLNKRQLTLKDFEYEGQRCVLTEAGRKTFFRAWGDRLETEATHPLFGYKLPYRRLIQLEARILAAYLLKEIPQYKPYIWK